MTSETIVPDEMAALYRTMLLIRRAEEILIEEYHPADEMRCPIHFCVGQEAAPAAFSLLLVSDDTVMTHYRSHGYFLAKGGSLDAMVAEFYGKATGANHGLAGSMELADHARHFYSGAIVAGPLAMAVGSAFAQSYRDGPGITLAVFGDGAMDEGVAYESFNLAALYHLPILFLCENNGYAAHTPLAARQAGADIVSRAQAFGVPADRVSDKDPLALHQRLATIMGELRAGGGPRFLEVETYRFSAHVGPEGDDQLAYRPADEVDAARQTDPLAILRARLLADFVKDIEIAEWEANIERQMRQAIERAKAAPFPVIEDIFSAAAANTSSPCAVGLRNLTDFGKFEAGQREARLAPY